MGAELIIELDRGIIEPFYLIYAVLIISWDATSRQEAASKYKGNQGPQPNQPDMLEGCMGSKHSQTCRGSQARANNSSDSIASESQSRQMNGRRKHTELGSIMLKQFPAH